MRAPTIGGGHSEQTSLIDRTKCAVNFRAPIDECPDAQNQRVSNTVMTTATLNRVIRDPRSGKVHLPSEQVAIMRVMRNLDRTLLKVAWQAGGDCVVFPEDLNETHLDS